MSEKRRSTEGITFRSSEVIEAAIAERIIIDEGIHQRVKANADAVRRQEARGRIVGDEDYDRRMYLMIEDGLGLPPRDWRGYDNPTGPAEPGPKIQPGPGAQESKLHSIVFDASLSPARRRKKVARLVDRQNRELAKRRQQGSRVA